MHVAESVVAKDFSLRLINEVFFDFLFVFSLINVVNDAGFIFKRLVHARGNYEELTKLVQTDVVLMHLNRVSYRSYE